MIKINKDEVNIVYLPLFENTENKCEDLYYLFEIKSKNRNEFTEVVLQDLSQFENRLRFNEFEFNLINNTELIDIFTVNGTYAFNVYEYDNDTQTKLNIVKSGMFYIDSISNFSENKQDVDYFIY